ncbi:hypothetical protein [Deinococcus cellulosilyticus]|uniref:Uncharacterized protein n=1 Tax=Deinococcus cellulosilyticus (strain DSM 18568 / NBRC 106333 / KACC 11606 / 5516J-15) TaxID=1223518 RepID=A0A511N9W8_DEIC1|nr:hypothetical protein [Deinococcus cellulosilyticus]GEM49629.1 hypothetical protein DC3_52640 [Deinococcus cellulosilyticus NBRC 106333 = KACC 11606]
MPRRKSSTQATAETSTEDMKAIYAKDIPQALHDRLALAKIKSRKTLQELYREAFELVCAKYDV